jgi:hypothetical protein
VSALEDLEEALQLLDRAIAERDVARLQRDEMARALVNVESELHRLRSELEAAHAKNSVLVDRLLDD